MKKALQVISSLEKEKVIELPTLGGATALLFYTEPMLTFDVDIFVFLRQTGPLIDLEPLYRALKNKGYSPKNEHVLIDGVPVQFIPVYNALVEEAVRKAPFKKYEGISFRVLSIEYLLAIMLDTDRPKDRERFQKLIGEVKLDLKKMKEILKRHSLTDKWEKEIEKSKKTN